MLQDPLTSIESLEQRTGGVEETINDNFAYTTCRVSTGGISGSLFYGDKNLDDIMNISIVYDKMDSIEKKLNSLIEVISNIKINVSKEEFGIIFKSRGELKKVFKKLFDEKLPFKIIGFNSIIVPEYVKEKLKNYNYKFTALEITKLSNLSKSEIKEIAKKKKEQKEKGLKLFIKKYGE